MNEQQIRALVQVQIASNPTLTDDELFVLLNTKNIPVKVNIPVRTVNKYIMSNGLWRSFKDGVSDAVRTAREALETFEPEINCKDSSDYLLFSSVLQLLVDDVTFAFTTTNKDELLAMSDSYESWIEQNVPSLTTGHIQRAREV